MSDSVIQKAVKAAAQEARIHKPVSVHTRRDLEALIGSRARVAEVLNRRRALTFCVNVMGTAALGMIGLDFETAVRHDVPI